MKLEDLEKNGITVIGNKDLELDGRVTIKFGIDPTSPDLHLGHMIVLRILAKLQKCGVKIVIVIGDFTAKLGDPTGKDATRPMLTHDQVAENSRTYIEQMNKILPCSLEDPSLGVTFIENSTLSGSITIGRLMKTCSKITVSKIFEHQTFKDRLASNESVRLHELLYPIIQAEDSIMIGNQVEIGGSDQLFNFTITRDLQVDRQSCILTPILVGLDGRQKMSKSLNNYVGFNDSPEVMRNKLSKMPDENVRSYIDLLTDIPVFEHMYATKILEVKKALIHDIIEQLYSKEAADEQMELYGRKKS